MNWWLMERMAKEKLQEILQQVYIDHNVRQQSVFRKQNLHCQNSLLGKVGSFLISLGKKFQGSNSETTFQFK